MNDKKIAKTFRLSSNAVEILERQPNATQFLEELILNGEGLRHNDCLTVDDVIDLIDERMGGMPQYRNNAVGSVTDKENKKNIVVPDPETGFPCCVKSNPCKHRGWDSGLTLWKNVITGKTREVI